MVFILFWLLNAFLLGLFGFDTMFINGAEEVFNLEITKTGYYFLFAVIGILKGFAFTLSGRKFGTVTKDKKANVQ